jgi:hypothetical protein
VKTRLTFHGFGIPILWLIVPIFQSPVRAHPKHLAQGQCSVESKAQYYRDFRASHDGETKDLTKALESAKKYLACSDSGDQQEILANLNLAVGQILSSKNSTSDAIPYFIRAASYDSSVKTSPQTYADLADAYSEGPYARLAEAYRLKYAGKDETEESLRALENIGQVADRMIDAYARAVALSGIQPSKIVAREGLRTRTGRDPADWIDDLIAFYKFRHKGSDAGLKQLIATVLSTPLPSAPVPIISLPQKKKEGP